MAEYPAFLFYPEDFTAGTLEMSPTEVGIYIRCLCHQWHKSHVPDDPVKVGRIAGASPAEMSESWPAVRAKFKDGGNGQLKNQKLENVRAELKRIRKVRSSAGRAGAVSRWHGNSDGEDDGNADGEAIATASQRHTQNAATGVEDVNVDEDVTGNVTEDETGFELRATKKMDPNSVEVLVLHYQSYHPKARAGDKERAKIRARLREGYTVEELKIAIDGCHVSPYHSGNNDDGRKYQNLELILRDATKVNQFIELAAQKGGPQLAGKSQRSLDAINSLMRRHSGG